MAATPPPTGAAPRPLGVTINGEGIEIAVLSTAAERIEICLFDHRGETELSRHALVRGDDDIWSANLPGIGEGARYGLRADGPYDPSSGLWFDPFKLLVDPYAVALDRPFAYRPELTAPRGAGLDTAGLVPKAIVQPQQPLTTSLGRHRRPKMIYELAVKAFTKNHPAVPEPLRGTAAALAHPAAIDHLVGLGVDTVELMPVAAWIDERHLPPLGLTNAWGYNPVVFMAPDPRLAPGGLSELRNAVSALQGAGIAVILDAVFNHTGESDAQGPTLSLRGLDSRLYYSHPPDQPGRLLNDTGCGNTIAAERPQVVRLIIDAMHRWLAETRVDGFRLDLAVSLGRVQDGFTSDAPLFKAIKADPVLSRLTIVAEPWDVGPGGYQLGDFPEGWGEWNDRFRQDVRRFWRGDGGLGALATRIAGSSDMFQRGNRAPSASINFVAAHDGFPLNDVVTYAEKHNEENGEQNRDGNSDNASWNHGVEGETSDPEIDAARLREIRAMLATLFVARGTPMLTAGDELRRTQRGNNNAYAQDNEITWLDWNFADYRLIRFVTRLIALRAKHPALSADAFLTGAPLDETDIKDGAWLHPEGREMTVPDWESGGRVLGLALYLPAGDDRLTIWINGGESPSDAWLPAPRGGRRWRLLLDTSAATRAPADVGLSLELPRRAVLIVVEVPAG